MQILALRNADSDVKKCRVRYYVHVATSYSIVIAVYVIFIILVLDSAYANERSSIIFYARHSKASWIIRVT